MSYDPECARLAVHFLQDAPQLSPDTVAALAQAIQDSVEDFLRTLESRLLAPTEEPRPIGPDEAEDR